MTGRVGEYELVRRIGHGGMAEVWMGTRAMVGGATKSVAIKFIAAGMASNDRHRKMFLEEARLSTLLSHSNIVQVFDANMDGERLYMVMEWVDGLDLSQICNLARTAGQPLSWSVVGFAIGEILQGLSYAHTLRHEGRQLGIVHRDISPHNVLVSLSGEVKLADFGIARLSTEETSGVHIKGKLRYMAPEHLAGRTKSPKVDLFGAGAILHELVSGEKFRAGSDEMSLYHQILGGVTPELTRADVPPELAALRLALLEPDENRRVESADAALAMLEAWAGYRNAKGELSRMCRAFMGVDAPRSGLYVRPEPPSVNPHADTEAPTAPTRTSAGGSQVPTVNEAPMATAFRTMPTGDYEPPARWPWVAGGLGALVLAGGSAWAVATFVRGSGSAAEGTTPTVAAATPSANDEKTAADDKATDEAADTPAVADDKPPVDTPTGPVIVAKPTETPPATPVDTPPVVDPPVGTDTPPPEVPPVADTPVTPTKPTTKKPKPDAKADPKPQPQPVTKLEVVFRVASPLRFAWVRIDGGSAIAVEPRATRKLTPGRHSIDWRADEANPWVSGGSFDFAAGSSPTIRVSAKGPSLE